MQECRCVEIVENTRGRRRSERGEKNEDDDGDRESVKECVNVQER